MAQADELRGHIDQAARLIGHVQSYVQIKQVNPGPLGQIDHDIYRTLARISATLTQLHAAVEILASRDGTTATPSTEEIEERG